MKNKRFAARTSDSLARSAPRGRLTSHEVMDEFKVPTDTQGGTAAPDVAATQVMDTQLQAPSGWGANVQPVVDDAKQADNDDDDETQAPDDYDDDETQAPDDYDDDATQAPEDDDEPAANESAGATMPNPYDEAGGISDDDATQAPPDSPEPIEEATREEMAPEQFLDPEPEPEPEWVAAAAHAPRRELAGGMDVNKSLPAGWVEKEHNGRPYYVNASTGAKSWTRPSMH